MIDFHINLYYWLIGIVIFIITMICLNDDKKTKERKKKYGKRFTKTRFYRFIKILFGEIVGIPVGLKVLFELLKAFFSFTYKFFPKEIEKFSFDHITYTIMAIIVIIIVCTIVFLIISETYSGIMSVLTEVNTDNEKKIEEEEKKGLE